MASKSQKKKGKDLVLIVLRWDTENLKEHEFSIISGSSKRNSEERKEASFDQVRKNKSSSDLQKAPLITDELTYWIIDKMAYTSMYDKKVHTN